VHCSCTDDTAREKRLGGKQAEEEGHNRGILSIFGVKLPPLISERRIVLFTPKNMERTRRGASAVIQVATRQGWRLSLVPNLLNDAPRKLILNSFKCTNIPPVSLTYSPSPPGHQLTNYDPCNLEPPSDRASPSYCALPTPTGHPRAFMYLSGVLLSLHASNFLYSHYPHP
jgi:hypothetical protein